MTSIPRPKFTLKTLLWLTAMAAGLFAWAGREASLVRQRRSVFEASGSEYIRGFVPWKASDGPKLSWLRQRFGDEPVASLFYDPMLDGSGEGLKSARLLFPEAIIVFQRHNWLPNSPGIQE